MLAGILYIFGAELGKCGGRISFGIGDVFAYMLAPLSFGGGGDFYVFVHLQNPLRRIVRAVRTGE